MFVKINSKRQVMLPARVLEALGVGPGDQIELQETPGGFILRSRPRPRPRRVDLSLLGGLRDKVDPNAAPFDIRKFREEGYDPATAPEARRLRGLGATHHELVRGT